MIDAAKLQATPFETTLIPARGNLAGIRVSALQVTESGIRLRFHSSPDQNILPDSILFEKRRALLAIGSTTLSLRLTSGHFDLFRRQYNLFRLRQSSASSFVICPACSLLSPATEGPVHFCAECLAMTQSGHLLTQAKGYAYNFCRSGFFQLLGPANGKAARPHPDGSFHALVDATRPQFHRIWGLFLWLALAIALLYLPVPTLLPNILAFAALTLLFSTFTLLLLRGVFRPLVFPPAAERATRLLRRGRLAEAEAVLHTHGLTDHPGHLSNLALAHHLNDQPASARKWLDHALSLCPSHPALQSLDQSFQTP